MSTDWTAIREAFTQAATWFVATCADVADHEDDAGLGVWSVRDLVGHTSRALVTVETHLAAPAATAEISSPAEYYRRVLPDAVPAAGAPDIHSAVAERGRAAGLALGDDLAAAVTEIATRVIALVRATDADAVLTSAAGAIRLRDYLPTRTVELVVHTCDLAVALGAHPSPPAGAAAAAAGVLTDLALARGLAGDLLLAMTGRRPLPPGFSVLG